MSIKHLRNQWSLGFVIAVLAISIAGIIWYNQRASADVCPDGWWTSTDSTVVQDCADEKAKASDIETEEEYRLKAEEPYYQTIPGSHPVVLLPQPEDTKLIEEVPLVSPDPEMRQAGPVQWIGATSLWLAGSVPNADYTSWDGLYVITHAGNGAQYDQRGAPGYWVNYENPTLSTYVGNGNASQRALYSYRWVCPRPVGSLTITNIVPGTAPGLGAETSNFPGLNYKVHFITPTGLTGQFDMTTQTWVFADTTIEAEP
ncbi:MAG TPA: hypothetical protein VJ183_19785 [Chloroflexia bacterium]|nr:hypothetical protein [Chloroflexia bacterium]